MKTLGFVFRRNSSSFALKSPVAGGTASALYFVAAG
jgi:hypothetical protein